jgi:bacterioferritin-associated ferredoxin
MLIDRCVCTGRSFAELLESARASGWTLDELAAVTGASRHCGLCRPYLERGFATGQTRFAEPLPAPPTPARSPCPISPETSSGRT